MSRSQWFIWPSVILFFIFGIIFYFATRSLRKGQAVKSVNADKEQGFRREVTVLDSVYLNYVDGLKNGDPSGEARAEALLNNEFSIIKKQYTGNSSPALLAAKLIRNYEVRVLLARRLVKKKAGQLVEVNRLRDLIRELEEENHDLKSKNQRFEDLLLTSAK